LAGITTGAAQIVHHLVRLRLDPFGQRARVIRGIGRKQAGHEPPAALLHDMAIPHYRLQCSGDLMEYRVAQAGILGEFTLVRLQFLSDHRR